MRFPAVSNTLTTSESELESRGSMARFIGAVECLVSDGLLPDSVSAADRVQRIREELQRYYYERAAIERGERVTEGLRTRHETAEPPLC